MNAPLPSLAEQAVIDRFGIFDAEEQVETVARALFQKAWQLDPSRTLDAEPLIWQEHWRGLAAAAIAALPPSPPEEAHGPARCVSVEDANRVLAEARGSAAAIARAAWNEGYEACDRGEQRYRNPYCAALASPAPAPQGEDACNCGGGFGLLGRGCATWCPR